MIFNFKPFDEKQFSFLTSCIYYIYFGILELLLLILFVFFNSVIMDVLLWPRPYTYDNSVILMPIVWWHNNMRQ